MVNANPSTEERRERSNARIAKANADILRHAAKAILVECAKANPDKTTLRLVARTLNEESQNFMQDSREAAARANEMLRERKRFK